MHNVPDQTKPQEDSENMNFFAWLDKTSSSYTKSLYKFVTNVAPKNSLIFEESAGISTIKVPKKFKNDLNLVSNSRIEAIFKKAMFEVSSNEGYCKVLVKRSILFSAKIIIKFSLNG